MTLSQEEAARFLLMRSGLTGPRKYRGPEGLLAYIRGAGCVRTDGSPLYAVTLLSHVEKFTREDLDRLLYQDRALLEGFEKGTCLLPAEDYPYLSFVREEYARFAAGRPSLAGALETAQAYLLGEGEITSFDGVFPENPALRRSVTEILLYRGDMAILRRENGRPVYCPAAAALPAELLAAPSPFEDVFARQCWQVLRRIQGAGLLRNAPGEVWLGTEGLSAPVREKAFRVLEAAGAIVPVRVEEITLPLYLPAEDAPLLPLCGEAPPDRAVKVLSPLDGLFWDRHLLSLLTGFSFRAEEGETTLPVLWGGRFAGRLGAAFREDTLDILSFRPEGETPPSRFWWQLEDECARIAHWLGLGGVRWLQEK